MSVVAVPRQSDDATRADAYRGVRRRIESLLKSEGDPVAAMATVVCELHHSFQYYDWTGFYRVVEPRQLAVGPYQGTHGCLRIDFDRGVCGAAARRNETIRLDDVHDFDDHIACSSSTISEIVVPVCAEDGVVQAVLDVDSDTAAVFTDTDRSALEDLADWLGARYRLDDL